MGRAICNKLVLTGLLLLATLVGGQAFAKQPVSERDLAVVSVAQLPAQGVQTYALISSGGPFPYDKDGVVFGNRERLLPSRSRGYYREYTVSTPGVGHRGKRRIVCGGERKTPEVCYYTADHYASFRKIVP